MLLKRYGWGVPDDIASDVVHERRHDGRAGRVRAVHRRRLPDADVPTARARGLSTRSPARWGRRGLACPLSYFVEPSAARRGWRRRFAYASHGLRFELRGPNETTPEFVRRVNRDATVEEDGGRPPSSGSDNWTVGPNQRNQGSLHQDTWSGHGAQLAGSGGVLAVHAVGGWWKNNGRKDRIELPVRYALIVSLRTQAPEVDIYTPLATALSVPAEAVAIEV